MKKDFTETELREILLSAEVGFRIREIVAEDMSADKRPLSVSREALFRAAHDVGIADFISEKDGKLAPTDTLEDLVESILSGYDEGTFWTELEGRLGERDFDLFASDEEFASVEKTGKYPERVVWYHQKYRKEFADHGIDRLEINEDV